MARAPVEEVKHCFSSEKAALRRLACCVVSNSVGVLLNHGTQLRTTARSMDRALQLFLSGGEIVTRNDKKRVQHGIVIDE